MEYRRLKVTGGTYFFTVVTHDRRPFRCEPENIELLRTAFHYAMTRMPFTLVAIVILPDHLHCIWSLPDGDTNFSTRWRLIRTFFSRHCAEQYRGQPNRSSQKKKEFAIWQRRFWEHWIRDEVDFARHLDYIHYNPVKHGLVNAAKDWQHSSFRRFVEQNVYTEDWGTQFSMQFPDHFANE